MRLELKRNYFCFFEKNGNSKNLKFPFLIQIRCAPEDAKARKEIQKRNRKTLKLSKCKKLFCFEIYYDEKTKAATVSFFKANFLFGLSNLSNF